MSTTLVLFTVAFLGAYAGLFLPLAYLHLLIAAILCGLLSIFIKHLVMRAFTLIACVGLVSAGLCSEIQTRYNLVQQTIPTHAVIFEGTLEDIVHKLDGTQTGTLQVTGIIDKSPHAASLTLTVHFYDAAAALHLHPSDIIRIQGKAHSMRPALAPGEFDSYFYGMARHIHGKIGIKNAKNVAIMSQPQLSEWSFAHMRHKLRESYLSLVTPREAAVLLALIDGDTSLFEPEQKQIYQLVGASHLLAVSGLQISLLAVFLFQILHSLFIFVPRIGRLSYARQLAAFGAIILVWLFVFLCAAPPSSVRAGLMATSMLVAVVLGRSNNMLDAFGTAGLLSVLYSPICVIDPSFLLSYSAVLGLLLYATKTNSLIIPTILTSFAASLMTFPITAQLFGQLALGGILVNIALVPIASFLQIPGILCGLLGALLHSKWLVWLGAQCAGILEAICDAAGDYIGYIQHIQTPSRPITLLYGIAAITFLLSFHKRPRWVYLSTTLAAVLISCIPYLLTPNGVRITALAIGQGDSTVVEFPSGHTFLIDGGGSFLSGFDTAESTILPFLQRRGIKQVDVMVVSHPDGDHILGLIKVAQRFKVNSIWHSGFDESHPLMAKLLKIAQKKHIPVYTAKELIGKHPYGNAYINVLAPQGDSSLGLYSDFDTNNNSFVLTIHLMKDSAFWGGDIEAPAEERLLQRNHLEKMSVVKASHHGSKTSSTLEFVKAVSPQHVIFCTKEDNLFGFPHSQVAKRWHNQGAILWNTGTHGQLTLWLTGHGVIVEPYVKNPHYIAELNDGSS